MRSPTPLSDLISMLNSHIASERNQAASAIADYLDHEMIAQVKYKTLTQDEYNRLVYALIDAVERESDVTARDSIYFALSNASIFTFGAQIDWSKLARLLPNLESEYIEYVISTLGLSGHAKYRSLIEPYINSHDASIRETAHEAIQEIDFRNS